MLIASWIHALCFVTLSDCISVQRDTSKVDNMRVKAGDFASALNKICPSSAREVQDAINQGATSPAACGVRLCGVV
jgi:hypothetical protein